MKNRLEKTDVPMLLSEIAGMGSAGSAEAEPDDRFLESYLPVPDHARALEPEVFLIIGERGAGKTELFRAIQKPEGREAIRDLASDRGSHLERSAWYVGYSSSGVQYPAALVFRQFSRDRQPSDLQLIWLGLLMRCLRLNHVVADSLPASLDTVLLSSSVVLGDLFGEVQKSLSTCFDILDRTDVRLLGEDKWVFLTYDELDRISAGDWSELQTILRGLVQFWASYCRRWKRIRPKIFLRRDLFSRVALFGPDVSKIAAQRVELAWSAKNIYALLMKRMVNKSEQLRQYFDPVLPSGKEVADLGWCPIAGRAEDYRKPIERLCGRYMGANPSKGMTFSWIPNHLQDGYGRVLPRSVVRLFESAAEIEITNRRASWPVLLHHASLRAAVDQVSVSRVQEIEDEEFPWMRTVRNHLAAQRPRLQVPVERRDLERALRIDWSSVAEVPPETSGHGIVQFLMDLGIVYVRGDGRLDARDLYLKGFGLKRKGGVARPD